MRGIWGGLKLAAMAALCLGAITAQAQVNPFGRYGMSDLTKEDLALMNAAAGKLRRDDSTPVGQTETWTNPASGTSGSVTLLKTFRKNDWPCQKIRHTYWNKERADKSVFAIDICRLPNGEWKML